MADAEIQSEAGKALPATGTAGEVGRVFLRLGLLAFGGPAAHVGLMEDEIVRRRGWLSREEFLDLLAVTNLIPGPNSTEMAIHIGFRRAGWAGWVAGGACFVAPAFALVLVLAWIYVRYGHVPVAMEMLAGVTPVIIVIIGQALWRLGRSAIKGPLEIAAAAGAIGLNLIGIHELIVLAVTALAVGAAQEALRRRREGLNGTFTPLSLAPAWPLAQALATAPAAGAAGAGLAPLFLFFLKVGSVLYGSGYVLLAFLRADLVERWGWLSEQQLLDAVAVGQVTPGPLFTTATFIGYVLAGWSGAILATLGIFLPAFFFVAVSAPLIPRLRESRSASAFLNGLNVGSLALMAVVTGYLARSTLFTSGGVHWQGLGIAGFCVLLLWRFRINSTWLVAGGAAWGLLASL